MGWGPDMERRARELLAAPDAALVTARWCHDGPELLEAALDEIERLRRPYPPETHRTHWYGCWREKGHHNCAVAEIERLRALSDYRMIGWTQEEKRANAAEDEIDRLRDELELLREGAQ